MKPRPLSYSEMISHVRVRRVNPMDLFSRDEWIAEFVGLHSSKWVPSIDPSGPFDRVMRKARERYPNAKIEVVK